MEPMDLIDAIIQKTGMGRTALAAEIGVAHTTLWQWHTGHRPPNAANMARLQAVHDRLVLGRKPKVAKPRRNPTVREMVIALQAQRWSLNRIGRECDVSAQAVANWADGSKIPAPERAMMLWKLYERECRSS